MKVDDGDLALIDHSQVKKQMYFLLVGEVR